jgi:hypothetical protein
MDRNGLLRLWRQVLRTCQLYPTGSPVRLQAAERFCAALPTFSADAAEGISLAFLEDGIWVCGEQAGDEEDRAPLARQLYNLGLREIRFLPGAEPAEILRLCDPLALALLGRLNPVDEDLSVLLWEADLPHVLYFMYEEPLEDRLPAPEAGPEPDPKEHPAMEEYLAGETAATPPARPAWTGLPGEDERAQLLVGYLREKENENPAKAGRLLGLLLSRESDSRQCELFEHCLADHLRALLAQGRLTLLESLRPVLSPRSAATGPANAALARLAQWMNSEEFQLQAAAGRPAREEDRAAQSSLVRGVAAAVVPELLARRLNGEGAPSDEGTALLEERLRRESAVQLACLQDRRLPVRRLALEVGHFGGEGIRSLQELLAESDPAIRILAVAALGRVPGPAPVPFLGPALCDREESVRLAATQALAAHGGPQALQALLRTLASRDFHRRTRQERIALYASCARAAPGEMRPFLFRLAERRGLWLSPRAREEAALALEALALLSRDGGSDLQARWGRHRPDLLRRIRSLAPPAAARPARGTEEQAA